MTEQNPAGRHRTAGFGNSRFRYSKKISADNFSGSKYPPAEPGALEREPLKAAVGEASARVSSFASTLARQILVPLIKNDLFAALGSGGVCT
jgi:hypothetical protein